MNYAKRILYYKIFKYFIIKYHLYYMGNNNNNLIIIIVFIILAVLFFNIPTTCDIKEPFFDSDCKTGKGNNIIISGCCDSAEKQKLLNDCIEVGGCNLPTRCCSTPTIKAKIDNCKDVQGCDRSNSSKCKTQCFAGSELILLENKEYKPISDIKIGDKILSADKYYNLSFSPVIYLPHLKNNIETIFIQIISDKNNTIKLTPEHNIVVNDTVIHASKVKIGDTIQTITGPEIVTHISLVKDYGIYTAITENEFIIVNNIIASPIAYVSHKEGTLFYNLLKNIHQLNPDMSNDIHTFAHDMFDYTYSSILAS